MLFRQKSQLLKKFKKSKFSILEKIFEILVFRPNMAIFLIGGFWANPASKHRSLIFLIEKNAFKTSHLLKKVQKIDIFAKG